MSKAHADRSFTMTQLETLNTRRRNVVLSSIEVIGIDNCLDKVRIFFFFLFTFLSSYN